MEGLSKRNRTRTLWREWWLGDLLTHSSQWTITSSCIHSEHERPRKWDENYKFNQFEGLQSVAWILQRATMREEHNVTGTIRFLSIRPQSLVNPKQQTETDTGTRLLVLPLLVPNSWILLQQFPLSSRARDVNNIPSRRKNRLLSHRRLAVPVQSSRSSLSFLTGCIQSQNIHYSSSLPFLSFSSTSSVAWCGGWEVAVVCRSRRWNIKSFIAFL